MSSLNVGMVILAVLYCCWEVKSNNPQYFSKDYDFHGKKPITGKNHIDKISLVNAICQSDKGAWPAEKKARCNILIESDVYSGMEPVSCVVHLTTEQPNRIIEILNLRMWGKDKAILLWWDLDKNDKKRAQVTIETVHSHNCLLIRHKLSVDNRHDLKPQLFVMPSKNSYDLAFMDKDLCGNTFCKRTVGEFGSISETERWFPNTSFIHAMEEIEDQSNKIIITIGESRRNEKETNVCIMEETGRTPLKKYDCIETLVWSSSNGMLSFCSLIDCTMFDYTGTNKRVRKLYLPYNRLHYVTLYNLPNGELLALICDGQSNASYRIIRIGTNGHQKYTFPLIDIKCSPKPEIMNAKFFKKSKKEHCLSLFYSKYNDVTKAKFETYCLDFPNMEDEDASKLVKQFSLINV